MKKVCVITGGGSGMGLATASIMGKDGYSIILVGRTASKLENAAADLKKQSIAAEAFSCDVADRESVDNLARHAKSLGRVAAVINAAGMSPNMGQAEKIMLANAIGTINVNEAFYEVMEQGSCIINVASTAAYLTPSSAMPAAAYKLSKTDKEQFLNGVMAAVNAVAQERQAGYAYSISKNFVIWYSRTEAVKMAQKGIRILSVSPGIFETPMGELEKEGALAFLDSFPIKRFGRPEEIAGLFAFCASDKGSYMTGIDILCDGGWIASVTKD